MSLNLKNWSRVRCFVRSDMTQVDAVCQCPHCKDRPLETIATLPFVRGTSQGAHFGVRTISGCVPCCAPPAWLIRTCRQALSEPATLWLPLLLKPTTISSLRKFLPPPQLGNRYFLNSMLQNSLKPQAAESLTKSWRTGLPARGHA